MIKQKKSKTIVPGHMLKIHIWSCELGGVLTAIRQPYFKKINKKVEQNSLNSFLCYPKLLNTFPMFYHGEF